VVEGPEWAESPAQVEAVGGCLTPQVVEAEVQRVQVPGLYHWYRVVPKQPLLRLQIQIFLHLRTAMGNLTNFPHHFDPYHVVLILPAVRLIDDVERKSWAWCWP